jgi:hypothetical protein
MDKIKENSMSNVTCLRKINSLKTEHIRKRGEYMLFNNQMDDDNIKLTTEEDILTSKLNEEHNSDSIQKFNIKNLLEEIRIAKLNQNPMFKKDFNSDSPSKYSKYSENGNHLICGFSGKMSSRSVPITDSEKLLTNYVNQKEHSSERNKQEVIREYKKPRFTHVIRSKPRNQNEHDMIYYNKDTTQYLDHQPKQELDKVSILTNNTISKIDKEIKIHHETDVNSISDHDFIDGGRIKTSNQSNSDCNPFLDSNKTEKNALVVKKKIQKCPTISFRKETDYNDFSFANRDSLTCTREKNYVNENFPNFKNKESTTKKSENGLISRKEVTNSEDTIICNDNNTDPNFHNVLYSNEKNYDYYNDGFLDIFDEKTAVKNIKNLYNQINKIFIEKCADLIVQTRKDCGIKIVMF